jgi:hypothetical protein
MPDIDGSKDRLDALHALCSLLIRNYSAKWNGRDWQKDASN